MSMPISPTSPAQLGFLAIFNPSLGRTDETIDDQIVYYASIPVLSKRQRRKRSGRGSAAWRNPTAAVSQAERNERLRQIGLAQGMVEFAREFSGGKNVDTVETERTRVVVREVEEGWWILAVSLPCCFLAAFMSFA
jgi:INTU/CCZ1/HPS4 family protein